MSVKINGTTGIESPGLEVDTDTLYVDNANDRVGIGTDTPEEKIDIGTIGFDAKILLRRNVVASDANLGQGELIFGSYITGTTIGRSSAIRGFSASAHSSTNSSGQMLFYTTPSQSTTLAERMRIDSAGRVLLGTTVTDGSQGSIFVPIGNARTIFRQGTSSTANSLSIQEFTNPNGVQGRILINSNSVTFSSISDYRLKEDVQPMANSIDRLMELKPVNFAWKVDGSRVDGFLAHEAQAIVPEAVTGAKDAVDEEGNPEYQGIDQSKLVPLLTAALQDAIAEIGSLKARIEALEQA
jgi:hypothetical protein